MRGLLLPGGGVMLSDAPPQSLAEVLGIKFGQCFTWSNPDGSTITWSIDMARRIIGDRPTAFDMDLREQAQAIQRNSMADEIDLEYAMTTDLSQPLIAVESPIESEPGKHVIILIDGWHRIAKSIITRNQTPLRVHFLTRDEEEACRIERM